MNDRSYKKDYAAQKKRGKVEQERRNARARARYAYDKAGVNRDGMDIDHKKPLANGGSAKLSNTRLVKPSTNRSYARKSNHTPK
jgi:hypothetical protein